MLIWGYVLTAENPLRTKTLTDVSVSFTGEADLTARNLAIRGNRAEILKPAEARVSTALTNYADLSANDVTATIDLKNINKAGKYRIPVTSFARDGKVESLIPEYVEVEIDDLVAKRIPVEYQMTGSLPEGYWSGIPTLTPQYIEIRGAKTDIGSIAKAVCNIDLNGRTENVNDAVNVMLISTEGRTVDSGFVVGNVPSVALKLAILPKKTVTFNLADSLLGVDNIPADYEVASYKTNPESITIVGQKEILDTVTFLGLESINVAGAKESILDNAAITFPDGVQAAGGEDRVEVYIDIREKQQEVTFENTGISIVGLNRRLKAAPKTQQVSVTLTGRVSVIREIEKRDVELFLDVSGYDAGTYVLPLQVRLNDEKLPEDIACKLSEEFIEVVITR
jgi:YbbR domain-containing protein